MTPPDGLYADVADPRPSPVGENDAPEPEMDTFDIPAVVVVPAIVAPVPALEPEAGARVDDGVDADVVNEVVVEEDGAGVGVMDDGEGDGEGWKVDVGRGAEVRGAEVRGAEVGRRAEAGAGVLQGGHLHTQSGQGVLLKLGTLLFSVYLDISGGLHSLRRI